MSRSIFANILRRRRKHADLVLHGVLKDALPSADGFVFDAELEYTWQIPGELEAAAMGLEPAVQLLILGEAERLTGDTSVLRSNVAESRLNSELHRLMPARAGVATITGARARLTVNAASEDAARELILTQARTRREEADRNRARERVEFFRNEILKDPASARLYLLLESPMTSGTATTQAEIDRLVEEVAAWHPTNRWIQVTALLRELFDNQPATAREALVRDFRELLSLHQRDDLATKFAKIEFSTESPELDSA